MKKIIVIVEVDDRNPQDIVRHINSLWGFVAKEFTPPDEAEIEDQINELWAEKMRDGIDNGNHYGYYEGLQDGANWMKGKLL